jgi:transitional endoplasmic reticulum ATPase
MSIPEAILVMCKRMQYLEQAVQLVENLDVFPYDGALALDVVLRDKYGWSQATATPTWFGPVPPSLINVKTGPDTFVRVPWGQFSIMGVDGKIAIGTNLKDGRYMFQMTAHIKRKDEATLQDIFNRVRAHLAKNSLYRGKAIKMKFRDDDGDPLPMPEPEFIDVAQIDPNQLIYSKSVHEAIETNLFTPIRRVKDCIANGIPVKRGVLLGGTYGTGKTLGAMVAARYAVEAEVTYIYIPRARELAEAIEFAKQYSEPACVIFCEDVDRTLSGERDEDMDEVLNLIDGIDTKNQNIIVVVTTNNLEKIEKAMLRPGRLDAVIEVTPPDAEAAVRLLRHYGGAAVLGETNLDEAGALLAGNNAAIIAEVVNRAKLSQLRLNAPGVRVTNLSQEALVEASRTMRAQIDLLEGRTGKPADTEALGIEDIVGVVVDEHTQDMRDGLQSLMETIRSVKKAVDSIKSSISS